jgi:hypothetical protein
VCTTEFIFSKLYKIVYNTKDKSIIDLISVYQSGNVFISWTTGRSYHPMEKEDNGKIKDRTERVLDTFLSIL